MEHGDSLFECNEDIGLPPLPKLMELTISPMEKFFSRSHSQSQTETELSQSDVISVKSMI